MEKPNLVERFFQTTVLGLVKANQSSNNRHRRFEKLGVKLHCLIGEGKL